MDAQLRTRRDLLTAYLQPQRGRVALLALLLFASIGLQLLTPLILRRFIDTATAGAAVQSLTVAALLFLGGSLVQQLVAVGATYVSENVGWSATNALRADLLLHCLRLDQSFHKRRTPGELIERIDGDVTALANFFSQLVIQVLGNLLLLIGVLVVLWGIDWRIGLLLTSFSLVTLVTLSKIQAHVVPYWHKARAASAELYGFLEERLSSTEDIRASGARDWTLRRLYERLTQHLRAERSARLRARSVWVTTDLYFAVATAATFVLGARLFQAGSLSVGTIYVIFFYTGLLIRPLFQITRQAEDLQKATAGIGRVQELFGMQSALPAGADTPLPAGALPVTFRDVSFGYEANEPVLRDVSFHLEPGRVVGLLGRTGSGKTTLTRLLYRLYDPDQGAILLGHVDLRSAGLAELRRRVGIVTQEVQLFHATIRDNLTFFDATIPDERILAAIDTLGLTPWFRALPGGLDTVLVAGSAGLSAGEAQLLAFTRIFLRDPGLVILDEASSRLDPATEQLIERAVDKLLQGRTGIVIAHRLHTVFRADEILILDQGQVVEHGERERLIADGGSRFSTLLRTGLEEALA